MNNLTKEQEQHVLDYAEFLNNIYLTVLKYNTDKFLQTEKHIPSIAPKISSYLASDIIIEQRNQ